MENDTPIQEKENIENIDDFDIIDDPESSGFPVHDENRTLGGEYLFSIVVIILGFFVAVPVLFIYFLKSPLPLQDVYTFGISYYNLVLVFLISATVVIISLLFFFKSRAPVVIGIFMTCLFCCLPLIIALKNDLTLQQAIENIPFFINWPFFLRPLYIFVEFLLPAGILAFLFLQLKNIFSKKPNNYTFLGAAVYLATAAFIGFTGLFQAGQPNIMAVLARKDNIPVVVDDQATAINRVSEYHTENGEEIQTSGALSSDHQGEITDQPEKPPRQKVLPTEYSTISMIDRKVQLLKDKMDKISKELEQVRISLKGQDRSVTGDSGSLSLVPRNGQPSNENALADIDHGLGVLSDKINQMDESLEKFTKPVVDDQPSAIVEIKHKVELLTGKVDQLLSRFNQAGYFKIQQGGIDNRSGVQSSMTKDRNTTKGELAEVLQKIELLSDKVNRISDTLDQQGIYVTRKGEKQNKQ
jgi:hypothetical protein